MKTFFALFLLILSASALADTYHHKKRPAKKYSSSNYLTVHSPNPLSKAKSRRGPRLKAHKPAKSSARNTAPRGSGSVSRNDVRCEVPLGEFARHDCKHPGSKMQCLTCNAFFEEGDQDAQTRANQVVLTLMMAKGFPKDVCGMVYYQQYKSSAYFSWTMPRQWTKSRNYLVLPSANKALCRAAVAARDALNQGPRGETNYISRSVPEKRRPRWARMDGPCKHNGHSGGTDFLTCPDVVSREQVASAQDLAAQRYKASPGGFHSGKKGAPLILPVQTADSSY